jgi:hypothetical protein
MNKDKPIIVGAHGLGAADKAADALARMHSRPNDLVQVQFRRDQLPPGARFVPDPNDPDKGTLEMDSLEGLPFPITSLAHAPLRRPNRKPGDGALQSYLRVSQALLEAARAQAGAARDLVTGEPLSDKAVAFARDLWPSCRDARVFEIDADVWQPLVLASMQAQVEAWQRIEDEQGLDALAGIAFQDSQRIPLPPEALPFRHVFVGLSMPCQLPRELAGGRFATGEVPHDLIQATTLGWLIMTSQDGEVGVVEMLECWTVDDCYVLPCMDRAKGVWNNPATLAPWVVPAVLKLIRGANAHATVEQHRAGLNVKRDFQEVNKRMKAHLLPKPYYVVKVRPGQLDAMVEEAAAEAREADRRAYSYRFDRRAHERVLVRRGPGLPSNEQVLWAEAHGYKLLAPSADADPDTAARLAMRGHQPKQPGEWLAIKATVVKATVVGDEGLPYIPAIRVPPRT